MVRAFIAIQCPEELKKKLVEVQKKISLFGKMKLVELENMHMTLKFLGDVDEKKIDAIADTLDSISENRQFKLLLKGVGVFPGQSYVRVIWVGVDEGSDRVIEIQKRIDNGLVSHGFERDKRFHPHFTLARVKSIDRSEIREFLQDNANTEFGSFQVTGIDLMESKLSPKGPIYSLIKSFGL